MTSHKHLLKNSAQRSKEVARNTGETAPSPQELQSPESMSPQNILRLQRLIGNAATQRMLGTPSAANTQRIGNTNIQRTLRHPHAVGMTLQRRLDFAPTQLTGKTAKTGIKKLFDNSHTSTFREIEDALDSFHKTARDDASKLQHYLTIIIDKSKSWLANIDHLSKSNETKRESLETLCAAAFVERRRVIITKELGAPYQLMDTINAAHVDDLWKIVTALNARKPQEALAHFDAYQSHLGDAAVLVKQFMIRNHIDVFNPRLAGIMNADNFQMDPKKGEGAKQLIINDAKAKLAEYKRLQDQYDAEWAAFQAESKKNPNVKQADYTMLSGTSPEALALGKLKIQKDQFQDIVNGVTVREKQKEKDLAGLSEPELYGIVGYTSELFSTINSGLRNNTTNPAQFTDSHMELAGAITSGLNKLKIYKGRTFRHNGDFPAFKLVNVQDATVVEIAPTSTAVTQQACATAGANHSVLEVFESITGRDVSKASVFGMGEQEILFIPGTRFKVTATFVRERRFWGQPHHEDQYKINGQAQHPMFAEAMKIVAADPQKKSFHRVIFKTEIK